MSDTAGGFATATTHDGFEITSNNESEAELHENLKESQEKKPGDEPEDPKKAEKERVSKAASELGKKGGEAAAKAKKAVDEQERRAEAKMAKDAGVQTDAKEPKAEGEDKAPDKEGAAEPDKPGHPRHDARARIQQLARERAEERRLRVEEEQKRVELEQRLARLEAERKPNAESATAGGAVHAGDDGPPDVDKFDKYEDWVSAMIDYKAEQKIKALREEGEVQSRQQAIEQRYHEQNQTFLERIEQAKEADPEIMDRVDPELLTLLSPTPPGMAPTASSTIADEVLRSEVAPHLLAYFTDHPEEIRKMVGMGSAREIARHVALIEARLGNGAEPPAPKVEERPVSRAKPPISPVQPSAQVSDEPPSDDADFDAHLRYWNAKDERARRGR